MNRFHYVIASVDAWILQRLHNSHTCCCHHPTFPNDSHEYPNKQPSIVVVSQILGVHRSPGHEPNNKNLQNKQGTDGGVPTGSSMLKLVLGDCERSHSQFYRCKFSHTFFLALPPLFMKKDLDPLSMGSG